MASECGLSRIHERCTGSKQETQLIIGDVKSGSGWERFGGRFTGDAALLLTPREYEVDALGGTSYDDNTVWHVWIWPEPPQPEGEYVETEPIHLYDVPTSTVSTTSYSVSGNQDSGITASASALTTEDFDWVDDSGEIGGHAHIETSTTADPANGTITTTITASGLPPGVTIQSGTTVTNVGGGGAANDDKGSPTDSGTASTEYNSDKDDGNKGQPLVPFNQIGNGFPTTLPKPGFLKVILCQRDLHTFLLLLNSNGQIEYFRAGPNSANILTAEMGPYGTGGFANCREFLCCGCDLA